MLGIRELMDRALFYPFGYDEEPLTIGDAFMATMFTGFLGGVASVAIIFICEFAAM